MAFDHAAVVVSERELLSELEQGLEPLNYQSLDSNYDFTIFAARPLPAEPVEHCFGSRTACSAPVRLKDVRDSRTCWIESSSRRVAFLDPRCR